MASSYYKPCKELDQCNELIDKYYMAKEYKKCFEGHLEIAQTGYPLAECQVGYFYLEGIGVEKDLEQAFYWTHRSAVHGDRDSEYNIGKFLEEGIGTDINVDEAIKWYRKAAEQNHDLAINKLREMGLYD